MRLLLFGILKVTSEPHVTVLDVICFLGSMSKGKEPISSNDEIGPGESYLDESLG